MNNPQQRKGFTFYRSFAEAIALLPNEDKVTMYEAITSYALDGEVPDMESLSLYAKLVWTAFLPNLEADRRKYKNGCKGGAPVGNTNANKNNPQTTENHPENNQNSTENQPKNNLKTSKEKENVKENVNVNVKENVNTAEEFVPPTIEEIDSYIKSRGFADVDAQSFADYYTSNGWKVGGHPMCDWQAAVRRWHLSNKQKNNNLKHTQNESKLTTTGASNAPRHFRNLQDDDYLRDAHPRTGGASADLFTAGRRATH